MNKLSIKTASNKEGSANNGLDFSHLENNPNYKPEGQEGQEGSQEEQEGQEGAQEGEEGAEGQEGKERQEGAEGSQANKEGQEGQEGQEGSQEGQEGQEGAEGSQQSSLDNEGAGQEGQATPEVNDEIVLKYLSEKLGRDLTMESLTPVEVDPQIKAINDWKEKTGRPIEDFFKYQKDYTTVSDLDIAREALQIKYPTLNTGEIELEMQKFIPNDEDLESDVAMKNLELKKFATEGRQVLNQLKGDLGEPSKDRFSPDIMQKIEFADEVQKRIDTNKGEQKDYADNILKTASQTSIMKLDLAEGVSIDFSLTDADKKEIPTLINEMPHWKNEDGSWNHQAVVNDGIKIKHFEKMLQLAYEQGVNSGTEGTIKKAKNSTLDGKSNLDEGQDGKKTGKPVIEDIDKLLGRQQMSIKGFGRQN